jgi:hypothetical protein
MVPNLGSREDVKQLQIQCSLSPLKWQHYCGVWHYHVDKVLALSPMNMTDLLFQPRQGHHVSLGVDFHIFDHVLLVNVASVVPENGKHAFSSLWLSLEHFLSGRSGVTILK